jgi:hypothetical protein
MSRLSNAKDLVRQCAIVLRSDKELSVFPAVSLAGVLVVSAVFALVLYVGGALGRLQGSGLQPLDYIILFLYYMVTYFVTLFCGASLVGAAMIRLRGGDPTLSDGFRAACQHSLAILGYSAISATVGLALGLLGSRGGVAGRAGSAIAQAGWAVLTFLAVPILVMEGLGPIAAIKRSSRLLKRTWGEQLIGSGGIGLISGLIIMFIILLAVAFGVVVAESGSPAGVAAVVGIAILAVAIVGLISASLTGIYRAALYSYATTGSAGAMFPEDLIKDAFSNKPGRPTSFVGHV